jgi:hypothetical protein
MKHSEFRIGVEFWCGGKRWRCTDVGSRVIVAISLEPHEVTSYVPSAGGVGAGRFEHHVTDDPSWLVGPPYAVVEDVFDEYDFPGCSLEQESLEGGNVAG